MLACLRIAEACLRLRGLGRSVFKDTLAERLRLRPAKPMGSPRVGLGADGLSIELSNKLGRALWGANSTSARNGMTRRNAHQPPTGVVYFAFSLMCVGLLRAHNLHFRYSLAG